MAYQILNQSSATEYVRNHPSSGQFLDPKADLECLEISDGNLNLVFRVFEQKNPRHSILLKQGIPYLRVAGESWPLSPERAAIEARALQTQHKLAPKLVPIPYWFDAALNINAMEDLRTHQVLRRPMVERTRYQNLGQTIGEFLAATLFGTSDFGLEAKAKKQLAAQFVNGELCEITEDLILTEPFEPTLLGGKPNRNSFNPLIAADLAELQADAGIRLEVARLKQRFMTCAQALLHGDLHTGSIMASQPDDKGVSDIRVIDPEFAFFGPMGFDVGLFVANLFLNSASQQGHATSDEGNAYREYLYQQAENCWSSFETGFREQFKKVQDISWVSREFQDDFVLEVLRDTCGYAGCEMIRRTVGFAHVYDLESIQDPNSKALAEHLALKLGSALIRRHKTVSSFSEMLELAKQIIGT